MSLRLPSSYPRFPISLFLFLTLVGLTACAAFPTATESALKPTDTALPASQTPTATPPSTATPTQPPSSTPTPTSLFRPFDLGNIERMTNLAHAGEGAFGPIAASPDGVTLAIAGSKGVWLVDKFSLETIALIEGHAGSITSVSWSPDGSRLISGGEDKTVRVWDISGLLDGSGTYEQLHLLVAHSERVTAVAWSTDPALIASASEDGNVWVWELSTNQTGEEDARFRFQLTHAARVYSLAWHPDGRFLATGSLDSTIDIWDAALGLNLLTIEGHESWVTTLAWDSTGTILASGATDRSVRLWDVSLTTPQNPSSRPAARANPRAIISLFYNPNVVLWTQENTEIVSAGGNPYSIDFWDSAPSPNLEEVQLQSPIRSLRGHFASIQGLAITSGGVLVSTGADSSLRFWDLRTGQALRQLSPEREPFTAHPITAPIRSLAWSPDGAALATVHNDYTVRLWDTSNSPALTQTLVITGHQNIINTIDWSANGNWLATGSNDTSTRVWDASTGELVQTLESEAGGINAVAWAPFGNQLATGGLFRIAQIWEVGTDQPATLLFLDTEITSLAWAPSGTLLAIGGNDGNITIWDVPASTQILLLANEHNNPISDLAWSPDGTQLATLDSGGKIVVWNAANGLYDRDYAISGIRRAGLSWSPNGQLLATANRSELYILDAETLQPLRLLTGHTGEIRSVEWNPDGAQLASAGLDGTLHLWATAPEVDHTTTGVVWLPSNKLPVPMQFPDSRFTGAPITLENAGEVTQLTMLGHGTALHLAAHPNNRYIAVAGGIGTWVYDASTWQPLRLLPGNKTYAAAWSPNGKFLAVREVNSVLIWDVEKEQVIRVLGMDIGVLPHLSWSPDSAMLAAGNFRGVVRVYDIATSEIIREWQPGRDITSLDWSPDGRVLAAGGKDTETEDGIIWLWDIPSGEMLNVLRGHTARVTHFAWSPDGARLLSAGDDLTLVQWDVSSLELPPPPPEGEEIEFPPLASQTLSTEEIAGFESMEWSPDRAQFFIADSDGEIHFLGAESGLIQSTTATSTGLVSATWLPNGEAIISAGIDGSLSIWSPNGEALGSVTMHNSEIQTAGWAITGDSIFTSRIDGTLQIVDLNGNQLHSKTLGSPAADIAIYSNTGLTAVRKQDGSIDIMQIDSPNGGRTISGPAGELTTEFFVDWSKDGVYLAWNQFLDGLNTIEIRGIGTDEQFTLSGAQSKVTTLSWSSDLTSENSQGRRPTQSFRLTAGTEDGKVLLWEVISERILQTIQAYSGRVRVIAWAPDGKTFATGGSDGQDNGGFQFVRIWNASTGRPVRELELPFGHEALSLVWSPDGTVLASGDSFGDILLWNPANGELIRHLEGHTQAVTSLDWSRVSNAIVSGSRDGTVRIWGAGGQ